MPVYEYKCLSCGRQHEILQSHHDTSHVKCPDCGEDMRKLISNTSFVLKGTGWYKTDYASPPKGKEDKKTSESAKDAAKTEKKTETPVKA